MILWKTERRDRAGFIGELAYKLGFDYGQEEWDSKARKPQSKRWGWEKAQQGAASSSRQEGSVPAWMSQELRV